MYILLNQEFEEILKYFSFDFRIVILTDIKQ